MRRRSLSRYRQRPMRKLRRRAVLKSGECNVLQSRISRRSLRFLQDIFTTLVDTQWRWTLLCFTLSFLLSWLGFGMIWWLIAFTHGDFDPLHLPDVQRVNNWTPCVTNIHSFTSCFLFSIETQHTTGYGGRFTTEECPEAIFIMCIQSISGVMIQAFMVGIVFAKMSRPKQRTQTLLFSKNAVICERDGYLCFMFRVGDMRKSHIIGVIVRAQMIKSRTTKEGEILLQHQQDLNVGTDGKNGNIFFIWPMTIVHKIDAESPFYKMSAENMLAERFEVVVMLEGTIESTGQTTQARSSYLPQEILWGHRFESIVNYSKERQGYEVDYSLFDHTTQVDTPLCSGRELAEFYRVQEELRYGTGLLVDKDTVLESYHDLSSQCHYNTNCRPAILGNDLSRVKKMKSEKSSGDSAPSRRNYRANYGITKQISDNALENKHPYKILEVDSNVLQVINDTELEQLPDVVNRKISGDNGEIVFENVLSNYEYHRSQKKPNPRREAFILREPDSSLNKKNPQNSLFKERNRYLYNTRNRKFSESRKYSRENRIHSNRHTDSDEILYRVRRDLMGINSSQIISDSTEIPELRSGRSKNKKFLIDGRDDEKEKLLGENVQSGSQDVVIYSTKRNPHSQEPSKTLSINDSKLDEHFFEISNPLDEIHHTEDNVSEVLSGTSVVPSYGESAQHAHS